MLVWPKGIFSDLVEDTDQILPIMRNLIFALFLRDNFID